MNKQVTYEDYSSLSGELKLSLAETLDLFDRMEWIERAFVNFPIDDTFLFQIIHNKNGFYTVEFTDSENMIFYQKCVDKSECREMIKVFFEKQCMTPDMLNGFELVQSGVKELSKSRKILYGVIIIVVAVALCVLVSYLMMNGKL